MMVRGMESVVVEVKVRIERPETVVVPMVV